MGGQSLADPEDLFLDTSILLNYVQSDLEESTNTEELLEHDSVFVICSVVRGEFEERCKTRRQIYKDIVRFVQERDIHDEPHPILEYTMLSSAQLEGDATLTRNDREHLLDLQKHFIDTEKKLYQFRKYMRAAKRRQREIDQKVTDHEHGYDHALAEEINAVIDNWQDALVLTQGVAWKHSGGSGVIVTLDQNDMTDQTEAINNAIESYHSVGSQLKICRPTDVI